MGLRDRLDVPPTTRGGGGSPSSPTLFQGVQDTASGHQRSSAMTPSPPDPSLPARLHEFHKKLPLAGDPPNALPSLRDDHILYLAAVLRDTPQPAPALTLEESWGSAIGSCCRRLPSARVPAPLVARRLPAATRGDGVPESGLSRCGRAGDAGRSARPRSRRITPFRG
jgi:hypothetical protein